MEVNSNTGMEMFLKGASFHGVMLDELFSGFLEMKKALHDAVAQGIVTGAVRPLSRTVFPHTEVEQAFRYSCHVGNRLDFNCKD
jgi:uncharacterized RDD family membrane protein YckC